jgi:hypothetical protein
MNQIWSTHVNHFWRIGFTQWLQLIMCIYFNMYRSDSVTFILMVLQFFHYDKCNDILNQVIFLFQLCKYVVQCSYMLLQNSSDILLFCSWDLSIHFDVLHNLMVCGSMPMDVNFISSFVMINLLLLLYLCYQSASSHVVGM